MAKSRQCVIVVDVLDKDSHKFRKEKYLGYEENCLLPITAKYDLYDKIEQAYVFLIP